MAAVCSVCKKKDQKFVPVEWCTECQKALCYTCSQKHKQGKQSKDHDTMLYSDYLQLPPLIKNITQTCPAHKEKFVYLCREHDQMICKKCLKTVHKKCKETPILKDIVEKVKTSHAFEDVTNEIKERTVILQNCIKELQNNLNGIQKQRKEMARSVENTMDRIMAELKKLKQDMLSDIDATVNTTEKDLIATMQKLQAMEKEMGEIIEQKQSITLHATNLQTYFGIKEMEKLEEETTRSLNELSNKGALDNINIVLDQTQSVDMLLFEGKLLGEVKVIKSTMKVETRKLQEAQNMTQTLPHQLQLQQTVNLGYGCYLGCCSLPNGMVVVIGYDSGENPQLKLINPDGTIKSTMVIDGCLYAVTAVDENHVAVSDDTTISMIDVREEKVTRSWETGNIVVGLDYRDGHIIFCSVCIGLMKINIDTGTIDNVINDWAVAEYTHVVTSSNRICYASSVMHTVTVLNLQHDVIFNINPDRLNYPVGVTVDNYNNVYVIGSNSNNVLVISPDGQKVHQLLSKDDGLKNPTGIHYDSRTRQLIVITDSNSTLCKYSLG